MARRDQIITVGGGFGGGPLNIGASINPNATIGPDGLPVPQLTGPLIGGGFGAGSNISQLGVPMLSSPFGGFGNPQGSPFTNLAGTLAGQLTSPTASSGGGMSGIGRIINVVTPPVTAVGTSFALAINFINVSPLPTQFRVAMTLEQLGIDMVFTPPVLVHPGQQGQITQTLAIPTVAGPNVGGYVGTVQLTHQDANGSGIADDIRGFTLPAPSGIAAVPGLGVLPGGQVIPPGSMGFGDGNRDIGLFNHVGTGLGEGETFRDHDQNLGKERDIDRGIGTPPFPMPGGGGERKDLNIGNCNDHTANATILSTPSFGGQPISIQGFNFCPGEMIMVNHHIVLHGRQDMEGKTIEQSHAAVADHTGRFTFSAPFPRLPPGIMGDGVISAHGGMSHKHANVSHSVR